MTHDELLAKIDADIAKTNAVVGLQFCRPTLKALRAVVELHKPCEPVSDDNFVTCETCNYEYFRDMPYPCPTIEAIEKELK